MLKLYIPVTGTNGGSFVATNGTDGVSTDAMLLNILIELRVANAIALDAGLGVVTQELEQYRSDVVNATVLPVI